MTIAQTVLEYLKVFLSAPVVAGAAIFTFLIMFRGAIRGLISRIATIKLPGGSELTARQDPPPPIEKAPEVPPPTKEETPILPAALDDKQVKEVRELLDAERARAYLWEYRYLNLFLVPRTQMVLEWLATVTMRPTVAMYDSMWSTQIPDVDQRATILNVLRSHHLVQQDGDLLQITPKGREYLEWRPKV